MIICPILSPYPIIVSVSQAPHQVVDASDLFRIHIFTIVMIKSLYHHCTFDDRTKTDTTWDGPYHSGVSRSRIMIRVSLPVHICDHDTRRLNGYGDRIGQMIHVWTRLKLRTRYPNASGVLIQCFLFCKASRTHGAIPQIFVHSVTRITLQHQSKSLSCVWPLACYHPHVNETRVRAKIRDTGKGP
jgi:hypothetical protein